MTDHRRRNTAEDTSADSGSHPLSRSTVRRTQTPRAARTGDHHSRPGALPPAPGWLPHVGLLLRSKWFPLVLLTVLVVVTEQVIAKGPLLGIDRWMRGQLLSLVASNPYPSLNTYARWWTHFGSPEIAVTALVIATLASAARTRSWKPLLSATLAGTALFATVIPGKILIGRPGPEGWLVGPGDLGWYPSGHTSTASVCLGTAAWILATGFALPIRLRRALYASTAALCASVGFTLMWCDYHWFLDVIGALCLSGVILWSLVRWGWTPEPTQPAQTQEES